MVFSSYFSEDFLISDFFFGLLSSFATTSSFEEESSFLDDEATEAPAKDLPVCSTCLPL